MNGNETLDDRFTSVAQRCCSSVLYADREHLREGRATEALAGLRRRTRHAAWRDGFKLLVDGGIAALYLAAPRRHPWTGLLVLLLGVISGVFLTLHLRGLRAVERFRRELDQETAASR